MKKRSIYGFLLALLLLLCLVLALYFILPQNKKQNLSNKRFTKSENTYFVKVPREKEIRAIWINYMELALNEEERTEEKYIQKVETIVRNVCDAGMNTVIVHVRPFCDAFYPSKIFPWSKYLSGKQGEPLPFDPLLIFLECAHKHGLFVEAWINPYRVSKNTDFESLASNHPVRVWHEQGQDQNIIVCEKGIYLHPSSLASRKLILDGVREILTNYKVDAIHLDDYFYPTTDETIDESYYKDYQEAGGKLALPEYRKENVNILLSSIYTTIQKIAPKVQLVISPSGNIAHNENELYANVSLWASQNGYCDVLMPQLYYGFTNSKKPFKETAEEWSQLVTAKNIKLCFGLAAYKCGKVHSEKMSDAKEWNEETNVLSRQLAFCRTLPNYQGMAVYGYTNIYMTKDNKIMQKEWKNLKNMLQ